jgi:hypothetical protein
MSAPSARKPARKASSVRHTRAIQRDRIQHPPAAPPAEKIAARLTELVYPAALAAVSEFHRRGLRERTLTLPVMVALVLSMGWRQLSGVAELTRLVQQEFVLWVPPLRVTSQALAGRLRTLPAELFRHLLFQVLPPLHAAWRERQRPLPATLAWAKAHFTHVLGFDASTLDALMRKVGLLQGLPTHPLAGRLMALLDLGSRLPWRVWFEPDPHAHEQRYWPQILAALPPGALVLFDLGYLNFPAFAQLTAVQVTFITRAKKNLAYAVQQVLSKTAEVREAVVWVGDGEGRQRLRLMEVCRHGVWYRYLTNELDPRRLPLEQALALYGYRWRLEEAFLTVKRLLGLAYFWSGAQNAVEMQLWATWLLYAVVMDLTDAVAEALDRPREDLSLTMVFRSLYYCANALARGETDDPVVYLATHAKLLGILKRKPRPTTPPPPDRGWLKGDPLDEFDQILTWY